MYSQFTISFQLQLSSWINGTMHWPEHRFLLQCPHFQFYKENLIFFWTDCWTASITFGCYICLTIFQHTNLEAGQLADWMICEYVMLIFTFLAEHYNKLTSLQIILPVRWPVQLIDHEMVCRQIIWLQYPMRELVLRCTYTSDLRHFGPNTLWHYVFGAVVSHIFVRDVKIGFFRNRLSLP